MNSTAVVGIVALLIGFGSGYIFGGSGTSTSETHTMSETMTGMSASLEGKTGDEFDRAFIDEMITHHEGAVDMARQALQHAKHNEIKKMAQDIIDAQTKEIDTMRTWLQEWYGASAIQH